MIFLAKFEIQCWCYSLFRSNLERKLLLQKCLKEALLKWAKNVCCYYITELFLTSFCLKEVCVKVFYPKQWLQFSWICWCYFTNRSLSILQNASLWCFSFAKECYVLKLCIEKTLFLVSNNCSFFTDIFSGIWMKIFMCIEFFIHWILKHSKEFTFF